MTIVAYIKATINRLLPRAAFARSVGILVGGTASAQALLIFASPILTRLYTPQDFGFLAVYAGLLSIFVVVATLRYELAIPLPDQEESAANLVALCFMVVGVSVVFTTFLVLFLSHRIASWLGVPEMESYLWLLPIGVCLAGCGNALRYFAIRKKAFGLVAKSGVKASLLNVAIQMTGAKFGAVSLIAGQAGSQAAGAISIGKIYFNKNTTKLVTWAGVIAQAARYKKFPIYSTWEGLLNSAGVQLPALLLAVLFNPAAAGFYALANRVLSLPMSLVGGAIGQVFLSQAAEAHRNGQLGGLVTDLHSKLAHVGLPAALLIFLGGPELFDFVFGAEWRKAGEFARWMMPWLYLVFVSSPLSTLFSVMEKQKQGMAFQFVLLVVRVIAIYAGAQSGDLMRTVILFSIVSAACWFGFLIWISIATRSRLILMARPAVEAGAFALICSLPLMLVIFANRDSVVEWLLGFMSSALLGAARMLYLLRKTY